MFFFTLLAIMVNVAVAVEPQTALPEPDETLISFGRARFQEIPTDQSLDMLVWNIYKAKRRELVSDLVRMASGAHFAVLQEVVVNEPFTQALLTVPDYRWEKAISFVQLNGEGTGVGTGSRFAAEEVSFHRSVVREPIVNTPKMIVITTYKVAGGTQLMVANIHAINFVTNSKYARQLEQLESVVKHHRGPLILAGDFNTHHRDRFLILARMADRLGLDVLKLRNDRRLLQLDHILTRGVHVEDAEVVNDVESSDHLPLRLRFQIR